MATMENRIALDGHLRKGPPQTAPQGEGHSASRRVPKSTKKVRAPPLPPSATSATPVVRKDQYHLQAEKTTYSHTASAFAAEKPTDLEQPQRPVRQKKQDNQGKGIVHFVSSGQTDESKNGTYPREAANTVTSASNILRARSSKRRPAPLPNQAPQIQTRTVPVGADIQQVSSGNTYSYSGCGEDTSKTNMPTKVSERSQPNLSSAGHTGAGDSAPDNEAPPLPSSAPPPLPSSPPPLIAGANPYSALGQLDSAEEISIEYSVPTSLSSSDFVSATAQAPSFSQRSMFDSSRDTMQGDSQEKTTGLNHNISGGTMEQHLLFREGTTLDNTNRESKASTKMGDDDSLDSDISTDDESSDRNKSGNYGFFSPGDSGRLSWSLTSSADGDVANSSNNEDGIVLLSNTASSGNPSKAANSTATQNDNAMTLPQTSPILQTTTSSSEEINPSLKNASTDSVISASTSKMTFSIPKHNMLDLYEEPLEPITLESPSAKAPSSPVQKPATVTLKTQNEPLHTLMPRSPVQKSPSPIEKPPLLSLELHKPESHTKESVSPIHTKPSSPSSAAPGNQEHQDLLASTAALIRSQKSATPRDISPQKSQAPKSPTGPSPVSDAVVKSGSQALFSPRRDVEHDIQKSGKENEIVAKAMHFADMTQPKAPTFVVRKAHKEDDKYEESEESIDPILKKHKAKARNLDDDSLENGIQDSGRSYSSNPSEYGYIYSAERAQPPPEVGWKERSGGEPGPVSLYSENVLREGDTTEAVDRESIANLSSTKKQWETIFTSNASPSGSSPEALGIKKKAQPRWEVRLPYKEKHPSPSVGNTVVSLSDSKSDASPTSTMSSSGLDTESAIEREIRLAHEREEMLKLEKAERERLKQEQQQQQQIGTIGQGQSIIASYEASSAESESYHPAFDELTEADRGPDLWAQGRNRDRLELQEDDKAVEVNPNESIIEREIRLQQERENEIASLRQLTTPRGAPQQQHVEAVQAVIHKDEEEDEKLTLSKPHDGESLIAQELRQLQEREEEIRRIHGIRSPPQESDNDQASSLPITSTPSSTVSANQQTPRPAQIGVSPSWQKDVSPFVSVSSSGHRRSSVDSASSHSTSGRTPSDYTPSRNVRVQPFVMDGDEDEEKPNYFAKQETPIEREMRIARERENDLRRQKGLPEIVAKEDDYYSSYSRSSDRTGQNNGAASSSSSADVKNRGSLEDKSGNMTPRSSGVDPMKRFASNRLQQELMQQKERELALRNEGKIISTSEEHIQPFKYTEVAGADWVDGKEKRNFVINSNRKSTKVSSADSESPSTPGESGASLNVSSGSAKKGGSVASGGQLFSYKEFRQTAESKIERELREMREREEELKMLRLSKAETPQ